MLSRTSDDGHLFFSSRMGIDEKGKNRYGRNVQSIYILHTYARLLLTTALSKGRVRTSEEGRERERETERVREEKKKEKKLAI